MVEYFIRYADNESWLRNDLQRGYSFKFYQFATSPEELLEEYLPEHLEDGSVDDLVEEFDIREHSDGSYGFAKTDCAGLAHLSQWKRLRSSLIPAPMGPISDTVFLRDVKVALIQMSVMPRSFILWFWSKLLGWR